MSSIYLIKIPENYKKIWLTGTKNFVRCTSLINNEIDYLKLNKNFINIDSVDMRYLEDYTEYDTLLSKNIVFINLFDASANNTIVECIIRNTPIIVNKLPAIVEYLGNDYPLYFNTLNDVNDILENKKLIFKAHKYLVNLNKEEYSFDFFKKKIFSCIH